MMKVNYEEEEEGYAVANDSDSDDQTTTSSDNSSIDDDTSNSEEEDEESFTRSPVNIYRLALRTNSEILEDLAAIIRILRQINALYRVFNNNSNNSFTSGLLRTYRQRNRTRTSRIHDSDTSEHESNSEDEDEEEANKLLEAGLEDLQAVLTNQLSRKKQSTLALLSLLTYQYNHCSKEYLSKYLDPNGEYNHTLAILAAAAYDEDHERPYCCRDIILAAEDIYGPDWIKEFHKGKEGALRKMLEKLTFVAKIRLKVRDSNPPIIR